MAVIEPNGAAYFVVFAVLIVFVVLFTKEGNQTFMEVTGWLGVFREEVILVVLVLLFVMMIIKTYNLDMDITPQKGKTVRVVTVEGFDADGSESFCQKYQSTPHLLHEECKKFGEQSCNVPPCCVWLNGEQCVAGNRFGPTYYSDDEGNDIKVNFFHHQRKCRGLCPSE